MTVCICRIDSLIWPTLTLSTDDMDEDEDAMSDDESEVEQPRKTSPSALPSIVEPLLALIQPTPLSFPPTSGGASSHPPTTSALSAVHICALECLNNIFLSLATPARLQSQGFASDADREVGPKLWEHLWRALGAVGTDVDGPGQERRREVWQTAAGVLWGAAILWKGVLVSGLPLLEFSSFHEACLTLVFCSLPCATDTTGGAG